MLLANGYHSANPFVTQLLIDGQQIFLNSCIGSPLNGGKQSKVTTFNTYTVR